MDIKPDVHLSYNARIWNIFIAGENKLLLELRDENIMAVSFDLYDIEKKEYIWSEKQLPEQWRVGISYANEDVIILHQFKSGTIPAVEQIFAIDPATGEEIWNLQDIQPVEFGKDYFSAFRDDEKVYVSLDKGELIETGGPFNQEDIIKKPLLPLTYTAGSSSFNTVAAFVRNAFDVEAVGISEYLEYENNIFMTYHVQENNVLNVYLLAVSADGEIWLRQKLNKSKNLSTDSFFIWSNYLIFVEGKHDLKAINLNRG